MEENKKIKNLISIIILLSGLFVGSLFVDFGQIINGSGYSQKNLGKSDVFEANSKTWVAFSEPVIPFTVLTDEDCESCDPGEVLVWLRRVMPTISVRKVNLDSEEGRKLSSGYGIKTLPAFIFDEEITGTDFFVQAGEIFQEKNGKYLLDTQILGVPVGKYVEIPGINEDDITFGNPDSGVDVIVFSDFGSSYSQVFFKDLREIMKEYESKAFFVFKEISPDEDSQSMNASLSAECAAQHGKFWEYSDKLFEKQTEWSAKKDTYIFKTYARVLGLNANDFNKCLDEKQFEEKIVENKKEADEIGIIGTPTIFINDEFENGAITKEELKEKIEEQIKEQ